MKKITCIILTVAMVLLLAACGSSSEGGKTTEAKQQSGGGGYKFTYNGTEIVMHEKADSVLSALGEAKSYSEAASCLGEGIDKTYFYGSFYVTTYPKNGADYIASAWFADDTMTTAEGICIGDAKDKVEKVYGADKFNGNNAYVIESGEMNLTIIMKNDVVDSITYTAQFN